MDISEAFRRLKRIFDTHSSIRRLFLLLLLGVIILWILGYSRLPSRPIHAPSSPAEHCLERRLEGFRAAVEEMDANVFHMPDLVSGENNFLPYVGNGHLGLALRPEAEISVKSYRGRVLDFQLPFRPFIQLSLAEERGRAEAMVSHFREGVVHHFLCVEDESGGVVEINSSFFASRRNPSVLEQNITVNNPMGRSVVVQLDQLGWNSETGFRTEQKKDGELHYVTGAGVVNGMGVVISGRKVPNAVQIGPRDSISLRMGTVVNYVHLSGKRNIDVLTPLQKRSEDELKQAMEQVGDTFYKGHITAWRELWNSGFSISRSMAEKALNGDKINATIYYVLSQVRAPLFEVGVSQQQINEANSVLSYSEGCYGGHHTLQAPSLWASMGTEKEVLKVCSLWILTLQKLGCERLLRAGASGVMQGMILSFGAFMFRNSHLEFNTEPKDLHRDYHFRRIWYGNATHVNVSVVVGSDNKASLMVALDRKDKDYFACDAGCLDNPVELSTQRERFPVKLTDPVTSVLYITSDKRHAEELHLSIHVKEVLEAPAHEHHVISMHRHGSGYSAMSTMFWVFLSLLIIIFHLFLFYLIYTEYFGPSQDGGRYQYRSRKVSDF